MAAARVRALLQSCDPQLLDVCGDSEHTETADASKMVLYLMDSRRVQKVLWRQLFVLDSMVALMEELKSARQLLSQPCPALPSNSPATPDSGARGRWKALKLQYKTYLEETENLLITQLQKIQQVHERREKLCQLLQKILGQGAHRDQFQAALLKAHDALRQSERQLQQLRAKAEVTAGHMVDWERIRDDLQMEVSLVQDVMKMKLLSLSASELSLEISPGSGPYSEPGSALDLDPLRLTVKWGSDDTFTLKVGEDACGLLDSSSGSWADLGSVLLEVLQSYRGQAELLTEIQALRSSFAIDWRPSQRRLVFLKSASVVCELQVEEGYPRRGSVQLLCVQREGAREQNTQLQNQEKKLSLTQWLLLLSSSPQV